MTTADVTEPKYGGKAADRFARRIWAHLSRDEYDELLDWLGDNCTDHILYGALVRVRKEWP